MAGGRRGSSYHEAETRTIEERRHKAISKPQKDILRLASATEWRTRRELNCAESSANVLVRLGILISRLDGVDMTYKLKKAFNE